MFLRFVCAWAIISAMPNLGLAAQFNDSTKPLECQLYAGLEQIIGKVSSVKNHGDTCSVQININQIRTHFFCPAYFSRNDWFLLHTQLCPQVGDSISGVGRVVTNGVNDLDQ